MSTSHRMQVTHIILRERMRSGEERFRRRCIRVIEFSRLKRFSKERRTLSEICYLVLGKGCLLLKKTLLSNDRFRYLSLFPSPKQRNKDMGNRPICGNWGYGYFGSFGARWTSYTTSPRKCCASSTSSSARSLLETRRSGATTVDTSGTTTPHEGTETKGRRGSRCRKPDSSLSHTHNSRERLTDLFKSLPSPSTFPHKETSSASVSSSVS